MAEFDLAYAKTSAYEGGYAKDPIDRGGETYRGIARLRHPGWAGWQRIDALKRKGAFPENLDTDRTLQAGVRTFYRSVFWDRCRGDELADQALADKLYDSAVNLGVRCAVRFLQSSLNLLNRNQRDYADLIEDGWFGGKTLAALDALLKKGSQQRGTDQDDEHPPGCALHRDHGRQSRPGALRARMDQARLSGRHRSAHYSGARPLESRTKLAPSRPFRAHSRRLSRARTMSCALGTTTAASGQQPLRWPL